MIGVYTHAFDFYYKAVPTESSPRPLLTSTWYNDTYNAELQNNTEYHRRWFNLSRGDSLIPFTIFPYYPNVLTRNVATTVGGGVYQNGALAWGSAASDFLWNVLTPSMSQFQWTDEAGRPLTKYTFTYNSKSFFHTEFSPIGMGVATYPITSSWIAYERKMILYASGSTSNGYVVQGDDPNYFPAKLNQPDSRTYSLPTAVVPPTQDPVVGENPTNITYGDESVTHQDGRFFDLAGGCGITRASVSASLVLFEDNKIGTELIDRQQVTTSLKRRRLFFPTIRTGSMAFAAGSPGAWMQRMMGRTSDSIFTENGGIYNIRFNIKRDGGNFTSETDGDHWPDSGNGSELLVFIHNVNTIAPLPINRVAGADGWYPPEANIVRIKNVPAMTFSNPATGYQIESFNINVVQYGRTAQLVFEASGSLDSNKYFGCIIDDVEFCKIGVTTDPTLIKPTTIGSRTKGTGYITSDEEDIL